MTKLPQRTSLSDLSDHDWNILSSRWDRGVDWYVEKVGARKWRARIGNFPLFKTKREADDAATDLLLAEFSYRAARRA